MPNIEGLIINLILLLISPILLHKVNSKIMFRISLTIFLLLVYECISRYILSHYHIYFGYDYTFTVGLYLFYLIITIYAIAVYIIKNNIIRKIQSKYNMESENQNIYIISLKKTCVIYSIIGFLLLTVSLFTIFFNGEFIAIKEVIYYTIIGPVFLTAIILNELPVNEILVGLVFHIIFFLGFYFINYVHTKNKKVGTVFLILYILLLIFLGIFAFLILIAMASI